MKRDDIRRVDQVAIEEYGIPGIVLMENAGRGAAEIIAQRARSLRKVGILCGSGNNGGDGYVIARHLELAGFTVHILALADVDSISGDAKVNAEIARNADIPIHHLEDPHELREAFAGYEILVECLLGTGAKGSPRGIYGDAVRLANTTNALRVAADIPAGLDCDTGQPSEITFQADMTLTFVATKDGFSNPNARPFLGEVHVVGIGVPKKLRDAFGMETAGSA